MYIPPQDIRYNKIARFTLFLCVMAPSGVVVWLAGAHDLLNCATAFLRPLAWVFRLAEFSSTSALCCSALLQAIAFFAMVRSHNLVPRSKATIAITWGMLIALILRLALAYEAWCSIPHRPYIPHPTQL